MTRRRSALALFAALVGLLSWAAAGGVDAQQPASGAIKVLPVRGNIYLLSGAGANIAVSVGKDGVLLIDSGSAAMADTVLTGIRDLSRRVTASARPLQSCVGAAPGCQWWQSSELLPTTAGPPAPRRIVGIVNTSDGPDHVGGNAIIAAAGWTFGVRNLETVTPGAWVLVHENLSLRLAKPEQPALVASESYFGREKKLNFFNGEGVVVTHHPAAHSDGDSMVYFRGSDVLVAGDILDMTRYPVIDLERGGGIEGVVAALNWILDVAVVEHMMEGGTLIVPGHGRMTDAADVAYYRDMVTIMRDRVREMITRGMTLEQITRAKLTRDYDGRFGKSPSWTPDMFIEAIYRSLTSKA